MNHLISSPTEVPTHLLRAAYLIGKVPFRACRSDSRVSYSLYIPEQYCKVHDALRQKDLIDIPQRLPLIVNVHSTRRDAVSCRDLLIGLADELGVAILAPLFPAGMDGFLDLDSYKNLRSETLQSDLVFLDMLNEITHIWPGINTDPIILVGFSGGAQFVHRFMYMYPERLAAVGIAAPGRVTRLSEELWPTGIGNVGEVFAEQEVDLEGVRAIPDICLFVGEDDNEAAQADTLELQEWLAGQTWSTSARRLTHPVVGRLRELEDLHSNWSQNGIDADFQVVPNVAHSHSGLLPAMLEWLRETPAITNPNP